MVIGIDATRANKKEKTGTEWYSYHLIQELKKLPNDEQFILYSKNKLHNALAQLPVNWKSKRLHWVGRFWTQIRLSLEMLIKRPDLLFISAHTIPLIHPKKTVITLHDVGFVYYPELYFKKDLWYHRWAAKFAIKRAYKIITVSLFSKKEICAYYKVDPQKIEVVHNGFNRDRYRKIADPNQIKIVLEKYDLDKRPYFLFIGRLEKKKNILNIIESFALFKKEGGQEAQKYQLVLVGSPGFGFDEAKELIEHYQLESDVVLPGWVDDSDLTYLYNGATVFLFPTFYEGFGIPVLEAMACGLPVITSDRASLPEVAGEAALLVNPASSREIAAAIDQLCKNKELREDLIAKGFSNIERFSWQKCAQKTLDILKKSL